MVVRPAARRGRSRRWGWAPPWERGGGRRGTLAFRLLLRALYARSPASRNARSRLRGDGRGGGPGGDGVGPGAPPRSWRCDRPSVRGRPVVARWGPPAPDVTITVPATAAVLVASTANTPALARERPPRPRRSDSATAPPSAGSRLLRLKSHSAVPAAHGGERERNHRGRGRAQRHPGTMHEAGAPRPP